jgi:radical SAM-linked protein
VENILRVRKTGFTIVPEAGTERLRRVINKSLENEDIWEAARNAFSRGWRLLKLYFMVGLPSEREEDLEGIVELVKEIIRMGYKILKKPPQINLSISSFIPKAHTPFQWEKMESEDNLVKKHAYIKSHLKKYSFVRFKEHSLKNALLEAVFSRGDRRLAPVVFHAWQAGARFDSWNDLFQFAYWEDAFEAKGIDYNLYLGSLEESDVLPWDHIDTGIKKSHLAEELHRAKQGLATPRCLDKSCAECQGCSLAFLLEKDFEEEIEFLEKEFPVFGKRSESVSRYMAYYSKTESAKYFSHTDVNNIIQRGFRRAGIPVCFTKGFHPKMIVSYPPALPLGMEGRAEVIEFKSDYDIPLDRFAKHINACLPPGIRFYRLERLEHMTPSLIESIQSLVYSLDLSSNQVKETLSKTHESHKKGQFDVTQHVEVLVNKAIGENKIGSMIHFSVDSDQRQLLLDIKFNKQKLVRPQDIVREIVDIENPVYDMAREKIVFKAS